MLAHRQENHEARMLAAWFFPWRQPRIARGCDEDGLDAALLTAHFSLADPIR
jgi:hypothetical protein